MPVRKQDLLAWFADLQRVYSDNKQLLTELDAAIGDADHGTNMDRGFTAVKNELSAKAPADIQSVLQTAATTLIRTVGGAAGPLYGTLFLRASTACQGADELGTAELIRIFRAGVEGVQQRGKALPGDKTMLDALLPAMDAMERSLENGAELRVVLADGATAAETGMQATIAMQAHKGRASYLGARSIGHRDPGATSSYLLLKTASDCWRSLT